MIIFKQFMLGLLIGAILYLAYFGLLAILEVVLPVQVNSLVGVLCGFIGNIIAQFSIKDDN